MVIKFIRAVELECYKCGGAHNLMEVSYIEDGKELQDYFCEHCSGEMEAKSED